MLALLLLIAGTHLVALATPGPDFFLISQVAASHSRSAAFKATLGIALGVFVWAFLALLGLNMLLKKMAWLQKGIMLAGGVYLCYLAFLLLRSAWARNKATPPEGIQQVNASEPKHREHFFIKGLLTNLSNPKAVIYFGSVFSAFVGKMTDGEMKWIVLAIIVVETILWFSLVSTIFSLPKMQKGYQRSAKWIDGLAGTLFAGFGSYLIFNGFKGATG